MDSAIIQHRGLLLLWQVLHRQVKCASFFPSIVFENNNITSRFISIHLWPLEAHEHTRAHTHLHTLFYFILFIYYYHYYYCAHARIKGGKCVCVGGEGGDKPFGRHNISASYIMVGRF